MTIDDAPAIWKGLIRLKYSYFFSKVYLTPHTFSAIRVIRSLIIDFGCSDVVSVASPHPNYRIELISYKAEIWLRKKWWNGLHEVSWVEFVSRFSSSTRLPDFPSEGITGQLSQTFLRLRRNFQPLSDASELWFFLTWSIPSTVAYWRLGSLQRIGPYHLVLGDAADRWTLLYSSHYPF